MHYSTTLTGAEPLVLTIGNFDGIHQGHQELLHATHALAQKLHSRPVFLTFQPHTLKVVRPQVDLLLLTTLEEKLELVKAYGIKDSIVVQFTLEVSALSASEFLDRLRADFTVRGLVVGSDFSLGHKRLGNVEFLREYGTAHGIEVQALPLEEFEHQRISSTRIRQLIAEGDVVEARRLLGHPVTLTGVVAHGEQRGQLLGFPTANLLPPDEKLVPANGVYAAFVQVDPQPAASTPPDRPCLPPAATSPTDATERVWQTYTSAVNIGVRPTFDGQTRLIEAHLLDVEGVNLYNRCISISFVARLRSEQRFSGIEALKAQIADDVQNARRILQKDGLM